MQPTPAPAPSTKRGPGRPRKYLLHDLNAPRPGRGRPAGAKDTCKRRRRNEKAVLPYEERRKIERGQQTASLQRTREAQNATSPSPQEVIDLTLSEDEQSEANAISPPDAELLCEFVSVRSSPPPSPPHHLFQEEANPPPANFAALDNGLSGGTYDNPWPPAKTVEDAESPEDLSALRNWSALFD